RATGRIEMYRSGVRTTGEAARGALQSSVPVSPHDALPPTAPVTYDSPSTMSRKDLKTMNPGRAIIQQRTGSSSLPLPLCHIAGYLIARSVPVAGGRANA